MFGAIGRVAAQRRWWVEQWPAGGVPDRPGAWLMQAAKRRALHGITMQILELTLADIGMPSKRRSLHLDDLASFSAVFVSNSIGITPVSQIDDHTFPVDTELMTTLAQPYESVSWDPI